MNKQSKFRSLLSLGMLLVLFGGGFTFITRSARAQSDAAELPSCLLVGTDNEGTDEQDADTAINEEGTANDTGEDETANDAGEDEAGDVDNQDEENADTGSNAGEAVDEAQDASYTGSIMVDESAFAGMSEADRCTALVAMATITAEEAQAAAEAEGNVVKVELDNENGYLVYSVELEDGRDVKVDAGAGSILHIEAADDTESGPDQTDEADAVAPANTGITADEAQVIAETETGSTTLAVEFDVEGGVELFEVEMADGTDVKVAASDGTILGIEQRDAN